LPTTEDMCEYSRRHHFHTFGSICSIMKIGIKRKISSS